MVKANVVNCGASGPTSFHSDKNKIRDVVCPVLAQGPSA